MLLEILHNTVSDYLKIQNTTTKIVTIHIELTPTIYDNLQRELNESIKIKNEIPIEGIVAESVVLYKRTVKLIRGEKLDSNFEKNLVNKMVLLSYNSKDPAKMSETRLNEPVDDSVRNLLQQ